MGTSHGATILAVFVLVTEFYPAVPLPQTQANPKIVNTPCTGSEIGHQQNQENHAVQFPSDVHQQNTPESPTGGVPQRVEDFLGLQQRPRDPLSSGFQNQNPQSSRPLEQTQGRPSHPQLPGFQNQNTPSNLPRQPNETSRPESEVTQVQPQPGTLRPSPHLSKEVEKHSSCGKFPSPGECQAAFPRYYYNASMSRCECYIFGGCDEAEGSYRTLEECHQKCHPDNKEEGPSCRFVYIENFRPVVDSATAKIPFSNDSEVNDKPSSLPSAGGRPDVGSPAEGRPVTGPPAEGFPNVSNGEGLPSSPEAGNSAINNPSSDTFDIRVPFDTPHVNGNPIANPTVPGSSIGKNRPVNTPSTVAGHPVLPFPSWQNQGFGSQTENVRPTGTTSGNIMLITDGARFPVNNVQFIPQRQHLLIPLRAPVGFSNPGGLIY